MRSTSLMRVFICLSAVSSILGIFTFGVISLRTNNARHTYIQRKGIANNNINASLVRRCTGCFLRPYSYLLNAPNVCRSTRMGYIELLIVVTSTAHHRDRRDAIRRTWLSVTRSHQDSQVRSVFLLGYSNGSNLEKLRNENKEYGDIVLQDFTDVYRNLTLKTLMGFEWAGMYCSSAKFIMKTDDDMFVNTTNIVRLIKQNARHNEITGRCFKAVKPHRNPKSKWSVTLVEYPESVYPSYCQGSGYVMSSTIASDVVRISADVPFFPLEDVYIGMCARELDYGVHHVRGFRPYEIKAPLPPSGCDKYRSADIHTIHHVSPSLLLRTWSICGFRNSA